MSKLRVTLSAVLVSALAACSVDGFDVEVVFMSLNGKSVPIALEADADPKDVKFKDRQKFKPSKDSETGLDRRFRMEAKKDGAAGTMLFERTATGDLITWIRIRVEELEGLEDDVSLAFLELRSASPADAGGPWRVEAVWDADIDGFRVSSPSGGMELVYAETHELFLAIEDDGADILLGAAEVGSEAYDGLANEQLAHTATNTRPDDPFTVAFGVEGLMKKGRFYFAHFVLSVAHAQPGITETVIGENIALALNNAYYARAAVQATFLSSNFMEFSLNPAVASAAYVFVPGALETLDIYDTSDGELPPLQADTPVDRVRKSLQKAESQLVDLDNKLAVLLQNGGGGDVDPKSARKLAEKAAGTLETAIAQLYGYKQKSSKKLHQIAEVYGPLGL